METNAFFIIVPLAIAMTLFLGSYSFRYFRSLKRRRAEQRRHIAIRTSAIAQAKGLAEKIKLAAHSKASQEDKDAAQERMQRVDELVRRFRINFLHDLGIHEITLRKHAHMATVDETAAKEKLAMIRAGKFRAPNRKRGASHAPSNVIPLHANTTPRETGAARIRKSRKTADGTVDCEGD